ncbi:MULTISPECIES: hypothetical protein [Streptomyces]|uniref:Uncharacterized protein n=1 Tax=Streptomyces xanthii TaxID=2768069 RepID=A0A7H1BBD3_9ACTN|nr:hypothetical protein [Streptomyces xanthii]QNS06038.1 hypothetical protein IAG42_22285 [Streptomyces xanthii]
MASVMQHRFEPVENSSATGARPRLVIENLDGNDQGMALVTICVVAETDGRAAAAFGQLTA